MRCMVVGSSLSGTVSKEGVALCSAPGLMASIQLALSDCVENSACSDVLGFLLWPPV